MADAAIAGEPFGVSAERRPQRVLVVLIPLALLAAMILVAAGPALGRFLRDGHVVVLVVFAVAAVGARAFPVPLIGGIGAMTFEFVVVVSAAILYGAAVAMVIAALAELLVQLIERREVIVVAYNGVSAVLQAAAAGGVAGLLSGSGRPLQVLMATGGASLTWASVNVSLGCIAVARGTSVSKRPVLEQIVRATTIPFVFMTSLVALIVVAWRESPLLVLAAIGPIVAIGLDQSRRIQLTAAHMMALTDPLTGLGNRRHFDERFPRELERAQRLGTPFSLCLLDLDGFKTINDTYGHGAGDEVLTATAACLRQDGEAFRFGGDEFALLLPGCSETAAVDASGAICARIGELTDPGGHALAVSAGTATLLSRAAPNPVALLQAADAALYRRKKERQADLQA